MEELNKLVSNYKKIKEQTDEELKTESYKKFKEVKINKMFEEFVL